MINHLPTKFIGVSLAGNKYPEVTEFCRYGIRLEVPAQYYTTQDLKGLIKFLKTHHKQLKAAQAAAE